MIDQFTFVLALICIGLACYGLGHQRGFEKGLKIGQEIARENVSRMTIRKTSPEERTR